MSRKVLVGGVALLLLLVLLLRSSPAVGSGPQLSIRPTSGLKGAIVNATGTGFAPSASVTVDYGSSSVASATTSPSGSFSVNFTVPSSSPIGSNKVTAKDSDGNTADAFYIVNSPALILTPLMGVKGITATISGSGFSASSRVIVTYDGATVSTSPESITTSSDGTFSATFTIPSSSRTGSNTVEATDSLGNTGTSYFTVPLPSLSLAPPDGPKGTSVTVSGAGFGASLSVTVAYDGSNVSSVTTTAGGDLSARFTIPSTSAVGGNTVNATDSAHNTAVTSFVVTQPLLTLAPTSGPRGTQVTASGSSFGLSLSVTITYDGSYIGYVSTSSSGSFSATLTIPSSSRVGSNTVAAADSDNNSATSTFTVTGAYLTIAPSIGPKGTPVTVTGSGYANSSSVTVTYDGSNVAYAATSDGTFTGNFIVPSSSPFGKNAVEAADAAGNTASASFTVISSSLSINPANGTVGTSVTVTGSGFAPSETITLTYDGSSLPTSPVVLDTTRSDSFTATITIPPSSAGAHIVSAVDTYGNMNSTAFDVSPSIFLSPSTAPAGSSVKITGFGFAPNSMITPSEGNQTISSYSPSPVTASTNGSFTATFKVPSTSLLGGNLVTATDRAGNSASATLTVNAGFVDVTLLPAPGSAPISSSNFFTIAFTTNGVPQSAQVNSSQTEILADASSIVSISAASSASNSSERWCLVVSSDDCQIVSFTVGPSGQQAFTYYYYDTLLERVSFSAIGGGSPAVVLNYTSAPSTPTTGYLLLRSSATLVIGTQSVWVAKGNPMSFPQTIAGAAGERWEAAGDLSQVSMAGSDSINAEYYHQYLQSFSYVLEGGSAPSGSTVSYTSLGSTETIVLGGSPVDFWADAGSTASATNPIPGPSGERWETPQSSWQVDGAGATSLAYHPQFLVQVELNDPSGGTVSPSSGWFSDGASVTLNAVANQGWKFEGWSEDGQAALNQVNLLIMVVSSPVNETAVLYAGLGISSSADGSVAYESGLLNGTVQPGSSVTLYLPPGSAVHLQATPSSPFSSLNDWSGTISLTGSNPTVTVTNPSVVIAEFGYNYMNVGGVVALVAVGAVGLALFWIRRPRQAGRLPSPADVPTSP